MELLASFLQTGGLRILIVFSFLLPFCDSVHVLLYEIASNSASLDIIGKRTNDTRHELHSLFEINMELYLYLLTIIFALRYLAIPRIQRLNNLLNCVYKVVYKS
jgi:hypothetical protein